MEFTAKQIAPPKDWSRFEDLCRALFSAVWNDPYAQKNGRSGQPQHGVDIWGESHGARSGTHCIQCKGKEINYHGKVTNSEFDTELAKAERFKPAPRLWILATTAPNDASLQEHVRIRSQERAAAGTFLVTVLGWESLIALMGDHPSVIEQFYPEHGNHMCALLAAVRALPRRDELLPFLSGKSSSQHEDTSGRNSWVPIAFETTRGLGPALLGRALGAADVGLCPRLPEAGVLEAELASSYSARLAGVPGAGKSVCALQAAEYFAGKGFRVVRLRDPRTDTLTLTQDDVPTVHLIDDAHLTAEHTLVLAEQAATPSKLLLSAFTTPHILGRSPGTIHLDAKRAVGVIADDLRRRRDETLAAVRLVDDWVGDGIGQEKLEGRLDAAASADFPWQFCFILSGGWRRVNSVVASARAAKADLVLGAIAIRQLATRDGRATAQDLHPMFVAAGLAFDEAAAAIAWLVEQRIVVAATDLRCPHQRFSAKVFDPLLEQRDADGRRQIARMMAQTLADPAMSLAGLGLLLSEFRMSESGARWSRLIDEPALTPFLERCWAAESAEDIAAAARALREIDSYLPDAIKRPGRNAVITVAKWFSAPQPSMAHAVGNYLNGTYRNVRYGRAIVRASDPEAIADRLNDALCAQTADFASEIAKMITQAFIALTLEWKTRYLARIDRQKCLMLASNWPTESPLYRSAWFCEHLLHLDRNFGLQLVDALGAAIGGRMRADPIDTFDALEDIFSNGLRIYDPLQVYKGKLAPTAAMREACGRLCRQWGPEDLARALEQASVRQFRDAAGVLNVIHKAAPELFAATVAAIDWDQLDRTLGADWGQLPHDAISLLCQFFYDSVGRARVADMIDRHLEEIAELDTSLAYIAPDAALRQIERGAYIALAGDSNNWPLRGGILADFHKRRPERVGALLEPHLSAIAAALSQESPTYFERALLFLRVCRQVAPIGFETILEQVDVATAGKGWTAALSGREVSGHKLRHPGAREAVAWLVHHLRDRSGALGDLARRLREEFPKGATLSAKKLETFSDL
ncbi:hypothetical protein [Sphingomonas sp. CFBP 8765]|uniref:hypothetical protein n=1 Tax=Sphingomonas sp. CFBP 8765 TaxID=2775274 RepID=UPI001A7E8365|nr:hypothetical protein [Sphingomonas sp. CFBP 8765]